MNQLKFMSREKLVEYLDEELRTFLNDKGIYEINQYGWLIDDSPDPEYLGLAMWQAEPPDRRSAPTIGPGPQGKPKSAIDLAKVFAAGREFEALMQTARQSIGFAFLYHETAEPLTDNLNFCFRHHYSDTVMKLNRATECLREMFINAFAYHLKRSYQKDLSAQSGASRDAHNRFCQPFLEAKAKLAETPDYYEEVLDCFKELLPLIEQASFFRIDGLEISGNHSFFQDASLGDISLNCHSNMLSENDEQPPLVKDFFPDEIIQWYKTLVKTGNQVFLAEYLLRDFDEEVANC
ncbi:MAG: hypothetical protein ABFQ82_02485 [Thermodesulfobacteriota bacterium]